MTTTALPPTFSRRGGARWKATSVLAMATVCLSISGCTLSPVPLTELEIGGIATSSLARLDADQEPLSGGLSLHNAMARALLYNLDHRVEMMQTSLRQTELGLAHYSLLPSALAQSGYLARDNDLATGNRNLTTGVVSPPTSTQHERRHVVSDITLSWNILDFGLSLVRARQAADRVLIAEEARRKVVHRIIEDVRTAYWRAVSSDRMIAKLKRLERRTRTAQANARSLARSQDASPIAALTYERELIEIRRTLQTLQHELSVAKTQLAALMNVRPGTQFRLSDQIPHHGTSVYSLDEQQLVAQALTHRAEIRDVIYQKRINQQEARAALLELLPGVQLYGGVNADSNAYLLNSDWVSWGAKVGWNLMRVFQYPAKQGVIDAQDALLDARTLALTMAIITQVHVSRIRYFNAHRDLVTARDYLDVQTRLLQHMRAEAQADRISEQTLIREELNTLVAEVKRDLAFASVQNAIASVFAASGQDVHSGIAREHASVASLSRALAASAFEKGDYRAPQTVAPAHRMPGR